MWSNLEESTSTRLLRSSKASSSSNSKMKRLNIQKLIPRHWHVKFVQAVSTDGILVTAAVVPDFGPSLPQAHKLILVSLSGKVTWIADIENPFSRPAIGKASLYLITYRMASTSPRDKDNKIFFMKLSLSTGSIEIDKMLPTADDIYGFRPANFPDDVSLVLSMDERYAMWVDRYILPMSPEISAWHNIICTTTGSLLYNSKNDRRALVYMPTSSITQNAIWAYGFPITSLTSQDPFDSSWATRCIRLPRAGDPCYQFCRTGTTMQLGFEGDRSLFSHLIHSKFSEIQRQERFWSPGNSTRMRTSKFGVSTAVRGFEPHIAADTAWPPYVRYTPSTPSVVTLPDGAGGRRDLEVKLPWSNPAYEATFFGFVEGSLAYHNRRDAVLLLIDFWPDW